MCCSLNSVSGDYNGMVLVLHSLSTINTQVIFSLSTHLASLPPLSPLLHLSSSPSSLSSPPPVLLSLLSLLSSTRPPLPPHNTHSQEIFHQLTEQARVFSQKDYGNALRLLAHSQPSFSEEKLDMRLKQLDTIFSQDAV